MTETTDTTQPTDISPEEGERPSRLLKRGGIFLAFLIIIAISALLGYQRGISLRTKAEASQITQVVDDQFSLALFDIEAGRYEIARQRLEYVAELYPGYPNLTDKLAEVLIILNATATPTIAPSPTAAPTALPVDIIPETALFTQAEEHLANEDWDQTINTLEKLRKQNPDFRAIDVDGMIYISLRQRGIQKISTGNLEGGIYDLTLAEGFGILDTEAKGTLNTGKTKVNGVRQKCNIRLPLPTPKTPQFGNWSRLPLKNALNSLSKLTMMTIFSWVLYKTDKGHRGNNAKRSAQGNAQQLQRLL